MRNIGLTMCHELLHTCEGCIEHNEKWLSLAKLTDKMYGYTITEYKEDFDIKHPESTNPAQTGL